MAKTLENNLEDVRKEIDTVMKNISDIVDNENYRGVVRNHSIEQITSYLNNLQNKYVFQTGYTVSYRSNPIKRRIGYEDMPDDI